MGALDEAAMLVARAEDPEQMREEVGRDPRHADRRSQRRGASIADLRGLGDLGRLERRLSQATPRDSFCAYIRTSASRRASEGSLASGGIAAAPQEAPTSTPGPFAVSAFAALLEAGLEAVLVAGEQHAELIAPDPVGGSVLADGLAQRVSEAGQQLVSRRMAEGVVVVLEAVEVEEEQRRGVLVARALAASPPGRPACARGCRGRSAGRCAPARAGFCSPCRSSPGGRSRRSSSMPRAGREAAGGAEVLHPEEPDHHPGEERRGRSISRRLSPRGGEVISAAAVGCQTLAPRQTAAIR